MERLEPTGRLSTLQRIDPEQCGYPHSIYHRKDAEIEHEKPHKESRKPVGSDMNKDSGKQKPRFSEERKHADKEHEKSLIDPN